MERCANSSAAECSALALFPGFGQRQPSVFEPSRRFHPKQYPEPDVMPDSRHNAAVLFLRSWKRRRVK
jgi:hypothetical protein